MVSPMQSTLSLVGWLVGWLAGRSQSELVEQEAVVGVKFQLGKKSYQVLFEEAVG